MAALRGYFTILALFFVAACGGAREDGAPTPDRPIDGEIALTDLFVSDFDLIDHHEQPATDERFAGKPLLIYFGFTTCPDVCPAALGRMTAALDALGGDADKVQALFITLDPARDTPARLAQHLSFDERILGLTGPIEAIDAAKGGLKVYSTIVDLPDSAMEYTVDHQSLFFVIDAEGRPLKALRDTMHPEDMATILRRTL